ncbi:MAG: tRNA (N6-isopentenyl adenosine(37)-C2)-methylthiotransferase MiaB [Desulfobacteraceae bacterium]|nr:MAG: tRNA (N6-isopentenyl adenosine(37)-C2)-methylthiotransferase MiaB [Desulfobacteraceae bacterium]
MKTKKNIYINTIGCQMNVYDSGRISSLLAAENYTPVSSFENADLVIVNTCAIREKAVQKVHSFLGRMQALKKKKPFLTVVVAGCVAQQQGAALIERFPQVNIVLGTHAIDQLPDLLRRVKADGQPIVEVALTETIHEHPAHSVIPSVDREVTGFVTIMRGCDNYCTYCVVPYVRGREISRKPESIIAEIRAMVQCGVKEITLLGQNVNSYGVKQGLTSFPELLARVNDIEGLERIRFVTSHPKDLSDQLIASFGRLNKLCNHIHLPVQSGANPVLKRMNRKYTREAYLEKIDKLRRVSPAIAISTDFIVGFPGETDADFNDTIDLMKTVKFDSLFAFEYSDRPEAPAARFSDKIPSDVKYQRLQTLLDLQKEITTQNHAALIGQVFPVLIEGESKNQMKKPEAGIIELSGRTSENRIVNFAIPSDSLLDMDDLKGQIMNIRIEKAFLNSLRGIAVENQTEFLKPKRRHSHVA